MMEATQGICQKFIKRVRMIVYFLIVVSPPRRLNKLWCKLAPILLVWWRQIPKGYARRPLRSLQSIDLEVPTLCWVASLWYPGIGRLFISATSITCGRFYILLLQKTQGKKIRVFPIYLNILTNLLMILFALLLIPLLCQNKNLLLMRLTPTTNQGSLIWHWRTSGLLSVVGFSYLQQLLWEWLFIFFWNCFVVRLRDTTMTNWSVSDSS